RGIVVRLIEKPGLGEAPELPNLFDVLAAITKSASGITLAPTVAELGPQFYSLIFDPERVGSLAYNLQSISRAASSVRDRISMDMWRVLSSLELPPFVAPGTNG